MYLPDVPTYNIHEYVPIFLPSTKFTFHIEKEVTIYAHAHIDKHTKENHQNIRSEF